MLRIGLTGGIASGKTTVAKMFTELGAGLVDTDAIARELVAPGSAGLAAVADAFGPEILAPDGSLDRTRLRQMVFSDRARRNELEAILHPPIRKIALERADACEAPYVLVAVPLLFETGFDSLVDRSLAVDCPVEAQIERLQQRDGVTATEARAIIANQMERGERLEAADDVIHNSGDLDTTQRQVARLHDQYLRLARNCPETEGRAE